MHSWKKWGVLVAAAAAITATAADPIKAKNIDGAEVLLSEEEVVAAYATLVKRRTPRVEKVEVNDDWSITFTRPVFRYDGTDLPYWSGSTLYEDANPTDHLTGACVRLGYSAYVLGTAEYDPKKTPVVFDAAGKLLRVSGSPHLIKTITCRK